MKFIDPRVDFAFRKIFGSEETKEVLKSFIEAVLSLEGNKKLKEINIINPYQLPKLQLLKVTILDVKCTDHRGITYLVEMQIKKTEAFLKRVQYNLSKSYSAQIQSGMDFPKLNQVIGITITDFALFPDFSHYLSCHSTRESITNNEYLSDILYYFIELSKFNKKEHELKTDIDRWVYFLKMTGELEEIPGTLNKEPYRTAFETAMISRMNKEEYELYDSAAMQIADHIGSLELAHKEGVQEGIKKGIEKEKSETAKKMLEDKVDINLIVKYTGLMIEEIKELMKDHSD